MLEKMSHNWWLHLLRGLVAIIFGIVALTQPGQTLQALVMVVGSFALAVGVLTVFLGLAVAPLVSRGWTMVLEGVLGIIMGLVAIFVPDVAARSLVYYIAGWALVTGILEIVAAVQLRRMLVGEWTMVLGGLLSVIFGVLLLVFPTAGEMSLVWGVGTYAIVFGIWEVIFAFQLQRLERTVKAAVGAA